MRPQLPSAQDLLPYLSRIDERHQYTNFGPLCTELESALCSFQEKRFGRPVVGVCVSNGTLGLELAIAALGLPKGSKVGVPAFTFPATVTAVQRCGLVPVALDIDPHSWALTPSIASHALEICDLRAVVPVCPFGTAQDANDWSNWSKKTSIPIIIDAAAAFGSQATASNVTVVFSLHATKSLSSCEGGLILCENPALVQKLKSMSNFGFGQASFCTATNAKLSEYHAAIGLAHLKVWPKEAEQRRQLLKRYSAALEKVGHSTFKAFEQNSTYAPTSCVLKTIEIGPSHRLEKALNREGIQTRRWYTPLVQNLPFLAPIQAPTPTKVADDLEKTILGLPFYLGLDDQAIGKITQVIEREL